MRPRSDGLTLVSIYHFISGFFNLLIMWYLLQEEVKAEFVS